MSVLDVPIPDVEQDRFEADFHEDGRLDTACWIPLRRSTNSRAAMRAVVTKLGLIQTMNANDVNALVEGQQMIPPAIDAVIKDIRTTLRSAMPPKTADNRIIPPVPETPICPQVFSLIEFWALFHILFLTYTHYLSSPSHRILKTCASVFGFPVPLSIYSFAISVRLRPRLSVIPVNGPHAGLVQFPSQIQDLSSR